MASARQFAQTQFGQTVSDWGSLNSGSVMLDHELRPAPTFVSNAPLPAEIGTNFFNVFSRCRR